LKSLNKQASFSCRISRFF